MGRMSRLKSTRLTAACGGVTDAVLVVWKSQTKEARIPKVRSSRVLKLIYPPPTIFDVRPVVTKLYPKGSIKSTLPVTKSDGSARLAITGDFSLITQSSDVVMEQV